MNIRRRKLFITLILCSAIISVSFAETDPASINLSSAYAIASAHDFANQNVSAHRPPRLGADLIFQEYPFPLIEGWKDRERSQEMAEAFEAAGLTTLRFSFHGYYSPLGPEATEKVKAENKLTNKYPWFPFDLYTTFVEANDFTTVIAVNVEEGPDTAALVIEKIKESGIMAKLVAIELSNEPWLNHRPWMPEDYAARAAAVIERLTPMGVRFALPLTVGKEKKTPTRLSDNEWNRRMLTALSSRIDLKNRPDIYGVVHLYSRGVQGKSIDYFNEAVRPFAPNMRYLVTEFNIRLFLDGNPHLTNEYALEFAHKLAELMARPEIEALYIHAIPYHSIMYWSNGRKIATVIGQKDARLTGEDLTKGWHLTPAGKVYGLYSRLAWNGEVVTFRRGSKQSYWAVKGEDGRIVVTLVNSGGGTTKKRVKVAGRDLNLTAPPKSIVCYDADGREIERLSLED